MSNTRFELPDGQWADIRDSKKITRGNRKPVRAAMLVMHRHREEVREWAEAVKGTGNLGPIPTFEAEAADNGEEVPEESYAPNEAEVEMIDDMQETLTIALVADWSFDLPITRESLNDSIPADTADALVLHCFSFVDQIFVSTDPSPDEDSPTQP